MDFLKSTEFGGKLQNSEALKTLVKRDKMLIGVEIKVGEANRRRILAGCTSTNNIFTTSHISKICTISNWSQLLGGWTD